MKTGKYWLALLLLGLFGALPCYASGCNFPSPEEALEEPVEVFLGTLFSRTYMRTNAEYSWKYEFVVAKEYVHLDIPAVRPGHITINGGHPFYGMGFPQPYGTKLLVFARLRDGVLHANECSSAEPNRYLVPPKILLVDVFEHYSRLRQAQWNELQVGIEARVTRIVDKAPNSVLEFLDSPASAYVIVELNKGADDGLYPGMRFCAVYDREGQFVVRKVEAKLAYATLSDASVLTVKYPRDGHLIRSKTGWVCRN